MSPKPHVSIVIANYNYDRFVGDAIQSALRQTYPATEVIVVDDGSADNSRAIISGFGQRIIPVFKPNGGHASAFNAGFACSCGGVVLFLDSDDMLLPEAARRAVECFGSPSVVHVHWPLYRVDADGKRTGQIIPNNLLPEGDLSQFVIANGPATWNVSPTSGNAWSRRLLDRIMPIPETEFRQAAESYLFTLSPIYGWLAALTEPQSSYRFHGSNYTLKPASLKRKEYLERYDHRVRALQSHLRLTKGTEGDAEAWRRVAWSPRLDAALGDIDRTIPKGCSLVLADEDQWSTGGEVAGRRAVPLVERDGVYWGAPADDGQALAELQKHLRGGIQYVAVGWPAFWWLDHFQALTQFLTRHGQCLLSNDRVVVFAVPQAKGAT